MLHPRHALAILLLTLGVLIGFGLSAATSHAATSPTPVPCTVIPWAGQSYAVCGPTTCATINNTTDRLAWIDSRGRTTSLPYRDHDHINVTRRVPASVRVALRKLTTGGPAIARACA